MSGIYIHIPFCKSRCFYCDFYSCTDISKINSYVESLKKEIIERKSYLKEEVKTIYFGGGTPSLLDVIHIEDLLSTIIANYSCAENMEITLEANPDDLSKEKIEQLSQTLVNRLSIGIQSFDKKSLSLMNRRHSSQEAVECVKNAQNTGFDNISIDLIYGMPWLHTKQLNSTLKQIETLSIQHLSAYHLTIEENTVFGLQLEKGTIKNISENKSFEQYMLIAEWAKKNNFIHYEISNFGIEGKFSLHNSNYWKQKTYIGVGPSAHSYNLNSRSWNESDIYTYINSEKRMFYEEHLTKNDMFNELLLKSLRTIWGINIDIIKKQFGEEDAKKVWHVLHNYYEQGYAEIRNNTIRLNERGFFISDKIISDMFKV